MASFLLNGMAHMKNASKAKTAKLRWLRSIDGKRVGLILPS